MMTTRTHYLFILLFGVAMLGVALFFQLVVKLEPCPLCIFQRVAIIVTSTVALLAFAHNPARFSLGRAAYGLLLVLGSIGSLVVASRHVWLLSLPPEEAASCGPGLEVALDKFISYLPQGQMTELLFRSGAECTQVDWALFGYSIPELTFPVFIILAIYMVWLFFNRNRY